MPPSKRFEKLIRVKVTTELKDAVELAVKGTDRSESDFVREAIKARLEKAGA